ncbi:hypothetical protein BH11BAC1_BH11BAC1_27560 [soil metagenome]
MSVTEDFLHILVATAAAMVAGYVWYHPMVFGTHWKELMKEYTGMTDEDLKSEPIRQIPKWFFVTLINSIVVYLIADRLDIQSRLSALKIAFALWAGFGLTFSSWSVIFARQRQSLWMINNGAFLFMQAIICFILVMWR